MDGEKMKITLMQQVLLKDKINTFRDIYKEFESNVIPHKGDMICDPVWKEPYEYEVIGVSINYNENNCYVRLPFIELESNDEKCVKEYIKMAKLHGWKCNVDF